MIDLHTHILPEIDDGPRDFRGSLELARTAAADGVRTVAATPHVRADHPGVRPAELAERCGELGARLRDAGVPLGVVPGGEVDLDWSDDASEDELRLVSYGQRGTDLLLETPYGDLPLDFEERLFRLVDRGFRILLAHPERSPTLQRRPARLVELVERGVLLQLTARTVAAAGGGSPAAELARELVDRGMAHVLASDAHAAQGPAPPDLSTGVAAAAEIVGARAELMATRAPAAVLSGEPIPAPPARSD